MVASWLLLLTQSPQHKSDIRGMKEKLGLSFKSRTFLFTLTISLSNQKLLHYNSFFMEHTKKTQMSSTKTTKTDLLQVEDRMSWYRLTFLDFTRDHAKDMTNQALQTLTMKYGDHMTMEDINQLTVASWEESLNIQEESKIVNATTEKISKESSYPLLVHVLKLITNVT